ncbi:polysaccharide deacetylase family protein [Aneurinibacillus migulanus]|uniref:polysaccharide deacetylase family protein n=1 Tax=Aneurinibacillus migulanus TaxID=47500 RepID=UPI0020A076AA|nr:polysaccharide deacetylase family protein [Aneurinibacillus migulanus]MCP1354909.1 polysaccharide deacetylase family protein [Aneurinibacillus migulanus]
MGVFRKRNILLATAVLLTCGRAGVAWNNVEDAKAVTSALIAPPPAGKLKEIRQTEPVIQIQEPEKKSTQITTPAPARPSVTMPPGKAVTNLDYKNGEKVIYLTFDDGPGPYTEKIVSVLEERGIRGSFFWIGQRMTEAYGHIGREMTDAGHVIGTHTMHHASLSGKSKSYQEREIKDAIRAVEKHIQVPSVYFRPPYGAMNDMTKRIAADEKQYVIYWDVDSRDWNLAKHPEKIIDNVLQNVRPGSIILLHERQQTLKVLPQIIDRLGKQGYSFAALPKPK